MKTKFNRFSLPEQSKVYLGNVLRHPICALNGINESSFSLVENLNNTYTVSFELDRYIEKNGKYIESNGFQIIDIFSKVFIENVGWFCIEPPQKEHDGKREYKIVTGESCEIEMANHNLVGLKINKGTTDSYEMLVDGNVEIIDGVEFAKKQIVFCDKENPSLSLLHILLKYTGMTEWDIGYVDDIPKTYKEYKDGKLVERLVKLSNEIGVFDANGQDLYSFLTQVVAQYYECIFVFDILHLVINVYRPEHLGENTNITIAFRNLEQSNSISVDKENIYTRYSVQGNEALGIGYVNYGSNIIENLDYFCNEKFMPSKLIEKYKLWKTDVEINRASYIENTKLYNEELLKITELTNRVPLDDCSTDWSKFSDEKLLEAKASYEAQKKGYESFYVDSNGNFDEEALKKSPDANDYYQIKDVILPSIQIEIDNRKLPPDTDTTDCIDSYKTDWKLYGLDELGVKLQMYKNNKKVAEEEKCTKPYDPETSGHTEDYHNKMYKIYIEAVNQLDPNFVGSCQEAYNQRQAEIDTHKESQKIYDTARKKLMEIYDKNTWNNNGQTFTSEDLSVLTHLYKDSFYTNENMFLTNSDDAVTSIDEQLKLLRAAEIDLEIASRPQYIYSTSLDNFTVDSNYKNYIQNLKLGNFIYLSLSESASLFKNYSRSFFQEDIVKLRIVSIQRNVMTNTNELQLTFSNMLRSKTKRDDWVDLLQRSSGRGGNNSSGNNNNFTSNEGVTLTPALIQKLVSSGAFINSLQQILGNIVIGGSGGGGGSISLTELNAKMIKVIDLFAKNGFFEYLQAKLISADKIVAGSGNFKELSALVAQIDNLLAGNISGELGHIIHLTAKNVQIDEAVIRDLIASQITVAMLQAGTISADKFNIKSDDGGLEIVGNTMQFKDANGNIRIQIGRDATSNFTFTLYDETGKGILIDSEGIKESAISDGLIINNMIADGTLGKEKFNFSILETDENGNIIQNGKVVIDKNGIDTEFISIKNSVTNIQEQIESIETNVSYTMNIFSSNGTTFRHGLIDTYLSPNLYLGQNDVTEKYPDKHFIWTRQSSDSDGDKYWNASHQEGTKSLHITNNDVFIGASFTCSFYLEDKIVTQAIF